MAEKLHVGIIGNGGMTKNHSRGYLNSGQYEIIGHQRRFLPAYTLAKQLIADG